jgi:hypothetical protein
MTSPMLFERSDLQFKTPHAITESFLEWDYVHHSYRFSSGWTEGSIPILQSQC